jgi:hypothetical protein
MPGRVTGLDAVSSGCSVDAARVPSTYVARLRVDALQRALIVLKRPHRHARGLSDIT